MYLLIHILLFHYFIILALVYFSFIALYLLIGG